MNKKPYTLRVAEHYMHIGKPFSYLNIELDFGMSEKTASHVFCNIISAGMYVKEIDREARPYTIKILEITPRNSTAASLARKKAEERQGRKDKKIKTLMRAWGGIIA